MNTQGDIWVEFAKSFGMLFAVLAFFLVALYLVRRFSGRLGAKNGADLIRVLCVHHLSPKQKLVLVNIREKTVLIGVSEAGMSRLEGFEGDFSMAPEEKDTGTRFQQLLKKSLGKESRGLVNSRQSRSADPGLSPDKGETL